MAKTKKPARSLQTGRNLPTRFSSYSPALDTAAPPGPPVGIEAEPHWRGWRWLKRFSVALLAVLLAIIITLGVWDARNISAASQKMFGSGSLLSLISSSGLKTDGAGRVNVLIAGYSVDDPGHAGAALTDSLILLSMDQTNHTGYMLSIPRDLYVPIPGFGHGKINEAYTDGGMPLLVSVAQNILGLQIGYYALVDYSAVRDIVNAIGGINVTINSPDGQLYDPNKDWTTGGPLVDLSNGTHHLDGEQALDLTRARGDPSPYGTAIGFEQSDFQRTADQRLVFSAIKAKMNWKLILNPRKNNQILSAIANNVKTNVAIGEAKPLFGLFNSIPNAALKSLSLRDLNGQNYLASSYYEGDTLTPAAGLDDFTQIDGALAQFNQ